MNRRSIRSLEKRKQHRRLLSAALALILLILSGLGAYLLVTRNLVIREIAFVGNHHLKYEDLSALVGLRKGDRMFASSAQEIHRRLMKSPWVKEAAVSKDLSGRVEVRLREAVPAAVLNLSGRIHLVEGDGALLEELKEATAFFLPVIRDIDPAANRATYEEALRLVRILHTRKLASFGGSLEIAGQRPEEITLTIDRVPIRVGVGDIERKLERLQFVKDEIDRRKIDVEYVDLRFLDRIVIKPVTPPAKAPQHKTARQSDGKKKRKS